MLMYSNGYEKKIHQRSFNLLGFKKSHFHKLLAKKCSRLTRVCLWKQNGVCVCLCVCRSRQCEVPSAARAFPTLQESLSDITRLRNAIVVRKRKEREKVEKVPVEGEMRLNKTDWFAVMRTSFWRRRARSGKTWTTCGACCWLVPVFFHFPNPCG